MSIFNTMADKIRDGIRTWLRVQPAQRGVINIQEIFDFEGNAIKNQIWYRGVSEELSQLYDQVDGDKILGCKMLSWASDKKDTCRITCNDG